jgi:hypothetical protein
MRDHHLAVGARIVLVRLTAAKGNLIAAGTRMEINDDRPTPWVNRVHQGETLRRRIGLAMAREEGRSLPTRATVAGTRVLQGGTLHAEPQKIAVATENASLGSRNSSEKRRRVEMITSGRRHSDVGPIRKVATVAGNAHFTNKGSDDVGRPVMKASRCAPTGGQAPRGSHLLNPDLSIPGNP